MQQTDTGVRQFREGFGEVSAGGTPEAMAAQFGEMFLAAGPQGANCVRREDFARILPQRKELFDRLGLKKTELVAMEVSMLDARFALAKTRWRFEFERMGHDSIGVLVNSTYMLDCGA